MSQIVQTLTVLHVQYTILLNLVKFCNLCSSVYRGWISVRTRRHKHQMC